MNNAYFSAAFAYGWHAVSTSRTVTLLGADPIKGSYDGHSINGRLETGIRSGAPNIGITPFAAAQMQRFFTPAYRETAGGSSAPFTLSYNSGSTNSSSPLRSWAPRSMRSPRRSCVCAAGSPGRTNSPTRRSPQRHS